MAKSLQEIEKDFYERYQQRRKTKFPLISDVIFCGALVCGGFSAMILSWGERGRSLGKVYNAVESYREFIIVIVLTLIVGSFVMKFCDNNSKNNNNVAKTKSQEEQ